MRMNEKIGVLSHVEDLRILYAINRASRVILDHLQRMFLLVSIIFLILMMGLN